jgi:hypothetical protein
MKEFGSLSHFTAHLLKLEADVALAAHHGLKNWSILIRLDSA